MTRAFWLGLLSATGLFLVLVTIAAQLGEVATETVSASNRSWVLACALAGVLAGFVGDRIARAEPATAARYAAAIIGPALLALLFAATTSADDQYGVWIALVVTIVAATLGAYARERIAGAQRRR